MKRFFKKMLLLILLLIVLLVFAIFIFLQQPKFGSLPSGERQQRIERSPNYYEGQFQNTIATPVTLERQNPLALIADHISNRNSRIPHQPLPTEKTDLLALSPQQNVLVWFGHSSFFMQINGTTILVDPVFSGTASPVGALIKAFPGTDIYTVNDLPAIDYLLITHDHWDHLDYETIVQLRPQVSRVICGLGVGAHFERWGYDLQNIIEKDWYEQLELKNGIALHLVPSRHFSGRGLTRNQSLWTGFVLKTTHQKIFISGDGGYSDHFREIHDRFGDFDLAIMENGQYNTNWPYIHLSPPEVLKAVQDLHARRLIPVHSGKFLLSTHHWREPFERISALTAHTPILLQTPRIGELVNLDDPTQTFAPWWTELAGQTSP